MNVRSNKSCKNRQYRLRNYFWSACHIIVSGKQSYRDIILPDKRILSDLSVGLRENILLEYADQSMVSFWYDFQIRTSRLIIFNLIAWTISYWLKYMDHIIYWSYYIEIDPSWVSQDLKIGRKDVRLLNKLVLLFLKLALIWLLLQFYFNSGTVLIPY